MANIERAKYCLPRKIQSYAIPLILDGIFLHVFETCDYVSYVWYLITAVQLLNKTAFDNKLKLSNFPKRFYLWFLMHYYFNYYH